MCGGERTQQGTNATVRETKHGIQQRKGPWKGTVVLLTACCHVEGAIALERRTIIPRIPRAVVESGMVARVVVSVHEVSIVAAERRVAAGSERGVRLLVVPAHPRARRPSGARCDERRAPRRPDPRKKKDCDTPPLFTQLHNSFPPDRESASFEREHPPTTRKSPASGQC